MRVNIDLTIEVVEEIDADPYSVDLADFNACGMGPGEIAAAVKATIEDAARKSRAPAARVGRKVPAMASTGVDYPLDPEQD